MDTFLMIGIIGMSLILLAFLMNQINVWKNNDLIYDVVNLIGSVLLIIYALPPLAYPFIVLNSVWVVFSLRNIVIDLRRKQNKTQSI